MNDVSEIKVMKSAAGYYLGRGYNDMGSTGHPFPYSRDSNYYPTEAMAQIDLALHFPISDDEADE